MIYYETNYYTVYSFFVYNMWTAFHNGLCFVLLKKDFFIRKKNIV